MRRIVVAGGSIAAVTAAQSLRADGFDGQLTVLSDESHPPYSRVPLCKSILAGQEPAESALLPLPGDDIAFRTGARAAGLDTRGRSVLLADGTNVPYDGLVVATGARARRLRDSDLVVRTLDDARELAARLATAGSAIVLGGGFLGMEVASTCRTLGLDTTVVDLVPPLLRLLGPWLADLVVAAARDHGVRIRVVPEGVDVLDDHRVRCGESVLEADVIVCAVGDLPNTEWLRDSGLPLDAGGGLVADAYCRVAPGLTPTAASLPASSPPGMSYPGTVAELPTGPTPSNREGRPRPACCTARRRARTGRTPISGPSSPDSTSRSAAKYHSPASPKSSPARSTTAISC
jgi:3-phenylpropionate/trans-cinnamate dioxygenase ferredoxin reductase subunit